MLSGSYAVAVSSAIFAVCIYLFKQGIKAHNELTNGLSGFLQLEEYTRMFRDAVHTISSNLESISSCIIEIGKG
jgi:hypothetical protein